MRLFTSFTAIVASALAVSVTTIIRHKDTEVKKRVGINRHLGRRIVFRTLPPNVQGFTFLDASGPPSTASEHSKDDGDIQCTNAAPKIQQYADADTTNKPLTTLSRVSI